MMHFEKNIADRKELVKRLGELTGIAPHYTKMPRCAYEVGAYTVERDGSLTVGEDEADAGILDALKAEGLVKAAEETIHPETAEDAADMEETVQGGPPEAAEPLSEAEISTGPGTGGEVGDSMEAEPADEAGPIGEAGPDGEESSAGTVSAEGSEPSTGAELAAGSKELAQNPEVEAAGSEEAAENGQPDGDSLDGTVSGEMENPAGAENTLVGFAVSLPVAGHTGNSLRNLVNMVYSRGPLLSKATGGSFHVEKGLADALQEDSSTATADGFLKAVTDYAGAHGGCIEGIEISREKISFTGFPVPTDKEHADSFCQLAAMMNGMALSQKRIQAKEVNCENEKYAFRIWLLRMGMNGDSYKTARKVLMENLCGHSAFRTPEEAEKARAKNKAKRDAQKSEQAGPAQGYGADAEEEAPCGVQDGETAADSCGTAGGSSGE